MELLPSGCWPVMLTPMKADLSIDWKGIDGYTEWLIELGAAGLFPNALSGEMFDLTDDEQLALIRRVVQAAAGRVPVVASSVAAGDPSAQAARAAAVAETGVDAVVLISSLVAPPDATDAEWIENVDHILAANPDVDFGVYECPLPFKRLLPEPTVAHLARTGRFTFFKDTSDNLATIARRVAATADTRLRIYNAAIGSLRASLRLGVAGSSGYAANIYPELVDWLCRHAVEDEPDVLAVQRLLTVAEHSVNLRYPSSAKYLLNISSRLPWEARSRWKPVGIGPHEGEPLRQLSSYLATADLGRVTLNSHR
ncbi:MAG: dihydrodipicolinate synthase family protein [Propionicimonas sp.]|nr:dihydrodipicolinate synthase family protein [Propionicimonas sp.]